MDDFARSTPAPAFDPDRIVRRTQRRRTVLAFSGTAAVAAAVAVALTLTFDSSPKPSTSPAAAPSGPVAVPNVIGENLQRAAADLNTHGLLVQLDVISSASGVASTMAPPSSGATAEPVTQGMTIPPDATVLVTNPIHGALVSPGTRVTITLGLR
jgi:beta-lactam-binding protein with PASTA domain